MRSVCAWLRGRRMREISWKSAWSRERSGKILGVVYMEVLLVWNMTATQAMLIPAFIRNSGSP